MNLFDINEIEAYPDLKKFVTAKENLHSLGWSLRPGYMFNIPDSKGTNKSHEIPVFNIAASLGLVEHLETLLVIVNQKNLDVFKPHITLKCAARCGQLKVAAFLIEKYPGELKNADSIIPSLEVAIRYRYESLISYLSDILFSFKLIETKNISLYPMVAKLLSVQENKTNVLARWDKTQTRINTIVKFLEKSSIFLPGIIEDVPADGNCFFHAISRQLNNLFYDKVKRDEWLKEKKIASLSHIDLRMAGIDYIQENEEQFASFFSDGEQLQNSTEAESCDDYIVRMSNSGNSDRAGEWADGIIIMALSMRLDVHIYLTELRKNKEGLGEQYPMHYSPSHHNEQSDLDIPTLGIIRYENHYLSLKLFHTNFKNLGINSTKTPESNHPSILPFPKASNLPKIMDVNGINSIKTSKSNHSRLLPLPKASDLPKIMGLRESNGYQGLNDNDIAFFSNRFRKLSTKSLEIKEIDECLSETVPNHKLLANTILTIAFLLNDTLPPIEDLLIDFNPMIKTSKAEFFATNKDSIENRIARAKLLQFAAYSLLKAGHLYHYRMMTRLSACIHYLNASLVCMNDQNLEESVHLTNIADRLIEDSKEIDEQHNNCVDSYNNCFETDDDLLNFIPQRLNFL